MSALDRVFPKVPDGAPRRQGWRRATGPAPAAAGGRAVSPGAPAPGAAPAAGSPLPPGGGGAVAPDDLLARRTELAQRLAKLQWDLGGLAYEMAIRDHFRPDVLVRQAARLQQVDGELGEVERMLRMEEAGAAGTCPSCGALHSRGAVYCWQCGMQLMGTSMPEPAAGHPAPAAPGGAQEPAPAPPAGDAFTPGDPLGRPPGRS
jgi:hypothetical protein